MILGVLARSLSKTLVASLALLAVIAALHGPAAAQSTIRMAVTDLEGMEQLQREFGPFQQVLVEKTGFDIELFAVANRTAGVEAMRSKKLEFAIVGPAEYVVFHSRTKATPVIALSRPDYFADVIVLADSGINSIADLKGKKVAMGSVGSTSKHLAPMQILRDGGLDPLKDVEVIHTGLKLGWEALKRGDVAAYATTDDKYRSMRAEDAELPPGAFKVIARGRDLPNDVLLAHPDVDKAAVEKIRTAILDHSDELVSAILQGEDNQKYAGMKFLTDVTDKDYDYVRSMYQTAGFPQFSEFPGE